MEIETGAALLKSHKETQRRYRSQHLYEQQLSQVRSRLVYREHEEEARLIGKIQALTHYGNGKCACVQCGEARLDCLSLDHIAGNGSEHRKELGSRAFGYKFYRYLRKRNYPPGYQTLCMNCQFIKMKYDRESQIQIKHIIVGQKQLNFIEGWLPE